MTEDMFAGRDVEGDARKILDTVADGGIAIFPTTVGYAIVGHTEDAVRRIYEAKQRSYGKPCGWFGNLTMFNDFIKVDDRARDIVNCVTVKHDLPLSIVAPFDADHPFIRSAPDFVLQSASLKGTMDMLLNPGALHNAVAKGAFERNMPVVGSSANRSLTGSKYNLMDVEEEVRAAASLCLDYGLSTWHNPDGMGSTIIDLQSYKTFRIGCIYQRYCDILLDEFDIDLLEIGTDQIPT